MNILLCDDDRSWLDTSRKIVEEFFHEKVEDVAVYDFDNSSSLISFLDFSNRKNSIIFLDIEMNNENGIDVATEINNHYPWAIIVFVTNHVNYASDVYSVKHSYFLVKSELGRRLPDLYTILFNTADDDRLYLNWMGKTMVFYLYEIVYIERTRRGCFVCTADGIHQTSTRFEVIADQLKDSFFVQCHNSYMINCNAVRELDSNSIVLKDNKTIPISRKYKESVRDSFYKIQEKLL